MPKVAVAPEEIKKEDTSSEEEKKTRKEQVLTQGRPSVTRSIADALVIKNENIYFLCQPDGDVPAGGSHGFGLYYHDCRYLNGYELRIAGSHLNSLVAATISGTTAVLELTNPEMKIDEGEHIRSNEIGLSWERTLDGKENVLQDKIRIKNYSGKRVRFPLCFTFGSDFEDVFYIRGLLKDQPGQMQAPKWERDTLDFAYEGADHIHRSLHILASPGPDRSKDTSAFFDVDLEAREESQITINLQVREGSSPHRLSSGHNARDMGQAEGAFRLLTERTSFQSDSLLLNRVMGKAMDDLQMLVTRLDEYDFFAAGIPWFTTLFGRDSLITALQTLSINPEIAAETLRLLAKFQADQADNWRDAQPGKILHELRVGELAHLDEIPQTPYYGTVDATPLFLILLVEYTRWTGDLSLLHELWANVERALDWIDQYGDANGDGYVEYQSMSRKGLVNQGWKDSGDAILQKDGTLARPPISLVEVQAYVYKAKRGLADLFERVGEKDRAQNLREQADTLKEHFNQDFWLDKEGVYALALESHGKPLQVVSSNPGHALWAGIADQDKAGQTVDRLMKADMFSGWGIRTLSSRAVGYNPIGYHLGTVWPHDNALIAAGFRQYGFQEASQRILKGIFEAAMSFDGFRLPELFAGFSRSEYSVPVHYPVACHPQAWAAGSIPYLVTTSLGLEPAAFEQSLVVRNPLLPDFVDRIQVKKLRVGEASVDLYFERQGDQSVKVEVGKINGKLDVRIE